MTLSREDIAAARDFDMEEIDVPLWGGVVNVRSMTSRHFDEIQEHISAMPASDGPGYVGAILHFKQRLVSFSICDAEGRLLFDDEEGRVILASKTFAAVNDLSAVAMRINNLSEEEDESEKKSSEPISTLALNSHSA